MTRLCMRLLMGLSIIVDWQLHILWIVHDSKKYSSLGTSRCVTGIHGVWGRCIFRCLLLLKILIWYTWAGCRCIAAATDRTGGDWRHGCGLARTRRQRRTRTMRREWYGRGERFNANWLSRPSVGTHFHRGGAPNGFGAFSCERVLVP